MGWDGGIDGRMGGWLCGKMGGVDGWWDRLMLGGKYGWWDGHLIIQLDGGAGEGMGGCSFFGNIGEGMDGGLLDSWIKRWLEKWADDWVQG